MNHDLPQVNISAADAAIDTHVAQDGEHVE
jgi:hypothetical protein